MKNKTINFVSVAKAQSIKNLAVEFCLFYIYIWTLYMVSILHSKILASVYELMCFMRQCFMCFMRILKGLFKVLFHIFNFFFFRSAPVV